MEKFTKDLLAGLYSGLQQTAMEAENSLQQFEKSYYVAEEKIKELKDYIESYQFRDADEEIRFFKEIKPLFDKEAMYFVELFNIESVRPVTTEEARRQHYEKVLDRLMDFFDQNRELYNYYRTGKTHMDRSYFVRTEIVTPLRPVYALDLDKNFSTPYSKTLGQLQAYEQLCSYLNNALYKGTVPEENSASGQAKTRATWSATKAGLIELAIALYFSGSVNFGKGGFKKFVSELEAFFNISLGNVYRVFLGMVIRKKDPTPFLHYLEEAFIRKLEEKSI
jgi:hypothetical protein